MATPSFATFDDVDAAYEGTIPDGDRPRVESLIRRASARIARLQPSVPYRLTTGELDPELPAGLVIEAVLRVYRNPEGVTAEEIGPFHKQFNPRAVAAEITLDEAEVKSLLAPIADPRRPSIRVALPTREQTLAEVDGQSWPSFPYLPGDSATFSEAIGVVKT